MKLLNRVGVVSAVVLVLGVSGCGNGKKNSAASSSCSANSAILIERSQVYQATGLTATSWTGQQVNAGNRIASKWVVLDSVFELNEQEDAEADKDGQIEIDLTGLTAKNATGETFKLTPTRRTAAGQAYSVAIDIDADKKVAVVKELKETLKDSKEVLGVCGAEQPTAQAVLSDDKSRVDFTVRLPVGVKLRDTKEFYRSIELKGYRKTPRDPNP